MSDRLGMIHAIHEQPDDDLPRLAYADWLEERGDADHAEFIRVECEAARTDRDSPTYPKLLRRSDQLRAVHAAHWFGPLADGGVVDHIITSSLRVDGKEVHSTAPFEAMEYPLDLLVQRRESEAVQPLFESNFATCQHRVWIRT